MTEITTENLPQIAKFDANKIATGIIAFEARKKDLTIKADSYKNLTILSADDKDGFKAVNIARLQLKSERVQIEKEAKLLRDPLTAAAKMVSAKEKELIGITEPIEILLSEKEKWYDAEKARIANEIAVKEADRLQRMADQLAALSFPFNIEQLKTVSDDQFHEALKYATEVYEKNEADKVIAAKLEASRLAAEQEQAKKDKEELEQLRQKNALLQKEIADKQAVLDAEVKKREEEKLAIEQAAQKVKNEELRKIELAIAAEKAAEAARNKLLADQKAAEEKRIKDEEAAKAEAERQARLAPDKEKFLILSTKVETLVDFEATSEEGQFFLNQIKKDLHGVASFIKSRAEIL